VDHSGLNKFASRADEAYGMIRDKLLNLLPPIQQDAYYVPHEPVSSYTSREKLSRKIAEELFGPVHDNPSNAGEFQALVIYGMGGVGKTQLALRYVEEHRAKYGSVMWIDAHTTESVRFSFERIATILKLAWDTTTAVTLDARLRDSPVVVAVMRWFSERDEADRRWLVVVDNADDTMWNMEEVIPRGPQGHVIVTSQHPQSARFLDGRCTRLNVGTMARHEARTLLRKHTRMDTQLEQIESHDLYDQIAERLGCLALAVDLAGAHLSEQLEPSDRRSDVMESEDRVTALLRNYVRDYNLHQDELLRWEPFYRLSSYEKTVWTVWNTSLAAIERTSSQSSASCLLTFLAQFKGGQVQEELFRLASLGWPVMVSQLGLSEDGLMPEWLRKMVASSNGVWDSFRYGQAILPLERYGLVQRETESWSGTMMHSLVQWRAGKESEQSGLGWEHWAWLFVMAAVYQTNRERSHPVFRRHMISHVHGMEMLNVDGGMAIGLDESGQASMLAEVGRIFYDEGRWSEAEKIQVQVMETRRRVLGEEHPDTLTSTANLALIHRDQGRWSEAEKIQVQVIETMTRILGEEHLGTLISIGNLASTYRGQRRWSEAEKTQVQIIETMTRILGEEHPDTLTSIANLASTYRGQGRWSEAEKIQVQVMETRRRLLGEEHPDTLTSIANLALIHRDQGRWSEAEKIQVQIIETMTRILGEEHLGTLTSMDNLASTYRGQRRWSEAEKIQVQITEAMTRILGEEHPDTLITIDNLASIYRSQGRWSEAEKIGVQMIETRMRVLGEEHPDTLISMGNLASTYRGQGRWSEAEKIEVQVMETRRRMLGEEHPDTLISISNLASTYFEQGRWSEAEKIEVQVMETRRRMLGEEHPDTLISMSYLAHSWKMMGRKEDAVTLMERCAKISVRRLGADHPRTVARLNTLQMWRSSIKTSPTKTSQK
jgi:tetratricopeptide (TPR) repeat protein